MRKLRVLLALVSAVILSFQTQAVAETYFIVGSFGNNQELVGDSLECNLASGRHTFAVRAGSDNTILGYSDMDHQASQKNYWVTGSNMIEFDMYSEGKVKIKMVNGKVVLTGDYAPRGVNVCSIFGGALLYYMGMDPNKDYLDMTLQKDGTWVYEAQYVNLYAYNYEYFAVFNHQKQYQFPSKGSQSFKIEKEGCYNLKFVYNPEAGTLTHQVNEVLDADAEAVLFLEGNLKALGTIVQGSNNFNFSQFYGASGTNFTDTLRVLKGNKVTIVPRSDDFTIHSITVDGQALEADASGYYTFVPQADSHIKVQATEIENISVYLHFNANIRNSISAYIQGVSTTDLKQGMNVLTFKKGRSLRLSMSGFYGDSCLVRAYNGAHLLTPYSKSVSFYSPDQGDSIFVETVTYSTLSFEGTLAALNSIEQLSQKWEDPNTPIRVINGIPVNLSFNTDYFVSEIVVNGESTSYQNFSDIVPAADGVVKIVGGKYGEVNVKLNIDNSSLIYDAYAGEESLILEAGDNNICLDNHHPLILELYSLPCIVKKNGVVLDSLAYGYYRIYNLQEGDVLEVRAALTIVSPTANENTAVVIIDDASLIYMSYVLPTDEVYIEPKNGTQYLTAGNYSVCSNSSRALNSVTLNHVSLEEVNGYYDFSLSHGDTLVVRATYDSDQLTLTFKGQTDILENLYQPEMGDISLEGLTSVQVDAGYYTNVKCSTDAYVLDSVLVNGKKLESVWLNSFTFSPTCDSEIRLFTSPAKDISVTLRVSELTADNNFSIATSSNWSHSFDVHAGDNIVNLKSSYGINVIFSNFGEYVLIRNGVTIFNGWTSFWEFDNFKDGDVIVVMTYNEWLQTDIESLRSDVQPQTRKCLIDGKVVILRNGRKYDLSGKEL